MKSPVVVVLSPNFRSRYTLACLNLLARANVRVAGVGVRRIVNPGRLWFEARRDGRRLAKKVWQKLLWPKDDRRDEGDQPSLSSYLRDQCIKLEDVTGYCSRNAVPLRFCADFNETEFVDWVRTTGADACVFTGGGLLRTPLLKSTAGGVINCHMGILPKYRGMDLPEWAILNGDLNSVGCSVHLMDEGVDTGAILATRTVALRDGDTIRRIRDRIEHMMPGVLVEATCEYLTSSLYPRQQSVGDGQQFFIVAPALRDAAELRLSRIKW